MSVLRSSQSTRIPFQKSVNKSENHTTSTAAQKQPSKRQDASSTFDSAENLVRWTTSHLRRPKSRSALARPMEVKNRSRNEDVVPEEANTQNSESSLSSSVTSTHSMTTDQSHTSIEEVTDTSESEFHDSPSREMSPPPFFYPVPQDMVPQVAQTAGIASGYATPSISLPASASTLTEFRSLSRRGSGVGHSPLRISGIAPSSGAPIKLDDSTGLSIPMASTSSSHQGLEVPTVQEQERSPGSLTRIREEGPQPHDHSSSLSVSTRFDEHGSGDSILNDTVPPTPTQIMSHRSSMLGAPTLWMTSTCDVVSGTATPRLWRSQLNSPTVLPSPTARRAPYGPERSVVEESPGDSLTTTPRRLDSFAGAHKQGTTLAAVSANKSPNTLGLLGSMPDNKPPLWMRRNQGQGLLRLQVDSSGLSKQIGTSSLTHDMLLHANNILHGVAMEQERSMMKHERGNKLLLHDASRSSLSFAEDMPREGEEELPPYQCTVHMEGYLPCKMENRTADTGMARGWDSMYFVVHGTALYMYKTNVSLFYRPNMTPTHAWNLNNSEGVLVHKQPCNAEDVLDDNHVAVDELSMSLEERVKQGIELGRSFASYQAPSHAPRVPNQEERTRFVDMLEKHHFHTYSMDGAQCGYAADYTKRPCVIRIKVANNQFLIQTRNNHHLVDWIEALQGSTNVSTDLDCRPMPKFVTLPRRRRHRRDTEAMVIRDPEDTSRARSSAGTQPSTLPHRAEPVTMRTSAIAT